jgi:hypothetical protein
MPWASQTTGRKSRFGDNYLSVTFQRLHLFCFARNLEWRFVYELRPQRWRKDVHAMQDWTGRYT